MSGLLTLLLFTALFFLMMRFGCGAHMAHGHRNHGGHEGRDHDGSREMYSSHGMAESGSKDPVCGMNVEADQGYSELYEGRRYRFCSRKCLDTFDTEPQRYAFAGTPTR